MHRTGDHNKSAAASVMRFVIDERKYVMSRILVLYGTTDGQTAKIAGSLDHRFRRPRVA